MASKLLDKLEDLERRYVDLGHRLADPETLNVPEKYNATAKERADIEPIILA